MSHKIHVNVWVKLKLDAGLLSHCPIDRGDKAECECSPDDDFESQVKHFFSEMDATFDDMTGEATIEDWNAKEITKTNAKDKTAEFLFDLFIVMDEGGDITLDNVINDMFYELTYDGHCAQDTEIVEFVLTDSR